MSGKSITPYSSCDSNESLFAKIVSNKNNTVYLSRSYNYKTDEETCSFFCLNTTNVLFYSSVTAIAYFYFSSNNITNVNLNINLDYIIVLGMIMFVMFIIKMSNVKGKSV